MNEPSTFAQQIKRFSAKERAIVGGIAGSVVVLSCCVLSLFLGDSSEESPIKPAAAAESPAAPPVKEEIKAEDVFDGRSLAEWQRHSQWEEAKSILSITAAIELTQDDVTPIARMRGLSYRLAMNGFNSEVKGLTVSQSIHSGLTGARWVREEPDTRYVAKVDQAGGGVLIVVATGSKSETIERPGFALLQTSQGVFPDSTSAAMTDAFRAVVKRPEELAKVDWKAGGYEGWAYWGMSPEEPGKVLGGVFWAVGE